MFHTFSLKRSDIIQAIKIIWGINSAGECYLHTVEVIGSNPIFPTIKNDLRLDHSFFVCNTIMSIFNMVNYKGSILYK